MSRIPLRVSTLVNIGWLANKLSDGGGRGLRLLDTSWHMPFTRRDGRQEFYSQHIPHAQYFGIEDCCDKNSPYDHMLPDKKLFEDYVGKLGINNSTHVVLYDNNPNFGLFSAPRVWWMFRYFGHHLVSVVQGGLPSWLEQGYDTTDQVDRVDPEVFKASPDPRLLKSFEEVEKNLKDATLCLLDARPAGRFEGTSPEPRPGIKPGHVPDAINMPFASLLDQKTRLMKDADTIKEIFEKLSVDFNKPVTAMCGSGVSACILALAAHVAELGDIAIYDGAWVEWYQRAPPKNKECVNV